MFRTLCHFVHYFLFVLIYAINMTLDIDRMERAITLVINTKSFIRINDAWNEFEIELITSVMIILLYDEVNSQRPYKGTNVITSHSTHLFISHPHLCWHWHFVQSMQCWCGQVHRFISIWFWFFLLQLKHG